MVCFSYWVWIQLWIICLNTSLRRKLVSLHEKLLRNIYMGREKKIFFSLCENFLINSGFDFLFQFVTGDSVITNYTELWGKTCNLNKKNSKKKKDLHCVLSFNPPQTNFSGLSLSIQILIRLSLSSIHQGNPFSLSIYPFQYLLSKP
jgi:hypothetical protein